MASLGQLYGIPPGFFAEHCRCRPITEIMTERIGLEQLRQAAHDPADADEVLQRMRDIGHFEDGCMHLDGWVESPLNLAFDPQYPNVVRRDSRIQRITTKDLRGLNVPLSRHVQQSFVTTRVSYVQVSPTLCGSGSFTY
jgi:hypothetical protein